HVRVGYPDVEAERRILKLARHEAQAAQQPPPQRIAQATILAARRETLALHMADAVEEYIVQLVMATRQPAAYDKALGGWIEFGASPRATIALDRCARARAWLAGRDYVSPDDVQSVCADVLRHRLILTFDAEAGGIDADGVSARSLELVPVARPHDAPSRLATPPPLATATATGCLLRPARPHQCAFRRRRMAAAPAPAFRRAAARQRPFGAARPRPRI